MSTPQAKEQTLSISWLNYSQHAEAITSLRRKVFVEEQGFEDSITTTERDQTGLHLGMFDREELVSVISIFIYKQDDPLMKAMGISSSREYVIQFSRRAELPEYRNHKYSSMLVAHALKSAYDLFLPDVIFATLKGPHVAYRRAYIKLYGFNDDYEFTFKGEHYVALLIKGEQAIKELSLNLRAQSIRIARNYWVQLPDLSHFIDTTPELAPYIALEGDPTNRYLQPISIEDELPRLSAQARLLFLIQEPEWQRVLAKLPDQAQILDLGSGPGVYFSMVSKLPQAKGKNFVGLEIDKGLHEYAYHTHKHIQWLHGSVYHIPLPDESVDLVHASFLFIHLVKPYLALKEIRRVLKPGGMLKIIDVNDDTFEGPEIVTEMIQKHNFIYEGNRSVLSSIEMLADNALFKKELHTEIMVNNSGRDQQPDFDGEKLKLGKWTMWALFAFMGQRDEVIESFEKAEEFYLHQQAKISIRIQNYHFIKP